MVMKYHFGLETKRVIKHAHKVREVDSDRQRNGLKRKPTRNFRLRTECKNYIILSRSKNSSDFTWNQSKPELTRPEPDVLICSTSMLLGARGSVVG
jgi:hypothetical protein